MSFLSRLFSRFQSVPVDLTLTAVTRTDCGLVRRENQDALVSIPALGLFAVADGMGGGAAGALASQWVCEALKAEVPTCGAGASSNRERLNRVDDVLQRVNARIRDYAQAQGFKSMGATVAFVLFNERDRSRAVVVHAGDSRVYRYRKGVLQPLTRDHTVGADLSNHATSPSEAAHLRARANPLAHILTRAVGVEFRLRLAWRRIGVRPGDRFLVCSDGVHDMLDDAQLAAAFARKGTLEDLVARLEKGVVDAGAGDNYSIVAFEARAVRR